MPKDDRKNKRRRTDLLRGPADEIADSKRIIASYEKALQNLTDARKTYQKTSVILDFKDPKHKLVIDKKLYIGPKKVELRVQGGEIKSISNLVNLYRESELWQLNDQRGKLEKARKKRMSGWIGLKRRISAGPEVNARLKRMRQRRKK